MGRKRSQGLSSQPNLNFDSVLETAEVLSREQVVARSGQSESDQDYSPIMQTAEYMKQAVQSEEAWESTIKQACDQLLHVDAQQLYMDFFDDLCNQINHNSSKSAKFADLLEKVAVRGFGMSSQHLRVSHPSKGATHSRAFYNGRENLDTESGKNKLDSSHHEKTTFTRFQS